ncbi:MAG: F0F1 ATP synthase subunit B [Gemmatimonadota bacterium]
MSKSMSLAALALLTVVTPAFAEEAAGPLTVEPGLMIWTIVVFLLLLFVLWKTAWPQLLGAVEAREKALEQMLADAERNRQESAVMLEEHRKLVAQARSEAQGLIAESKSLAEQERSQAMERTRHEQEELLARARREIVAEREKAIADLRREAVDLALGAASKLLSERIDSDADRKIVTTYLASLGATR